MKDDKEFTYNIYPAEDGSMSLVVREVNGGTVHLEEFLGVIAAYLDEAVGDNNLMFEKYDENEGGNYH